MAIRTLKNQFQGINPHLNSKLQNYGWAGFHTRHIGDLGAALRAVLFPKGYIANIEESLQIRRGDDSDVRRYPRADVMILDTNPSRAVQPGGFAVATQGQTMTLTQAIPMTQDDDYYAALAIRKQEDMEGDPVAWVELLSPGNKPGGGDYHQYREKRESLLAIGVVFVELDYLHESAPTIHSVVDYTHLEEKDEVTDAYPYRISVFVPRPSFKTGQANIQQFRVDVAIPTLKIPLSGDDSFTFDFDRAYQKTYSEMLYGNEVDYSQLPLHFERYTSVDRLIIARRMLAIHTAQAAGVDLERDTALETEVVSLRDALERMNLLPDMLQ